VAVTCRHSRAWYGLSAQQLHVPSLQVVEYPVTTETEQAQEPTTLSSPHSRLPRVLISSTIYDFRDLRSALRYWLREMGYDVQLSEKNDFIKDLDANSYDACLTAVQQADIFILLVGGRVGGWINPAEKLSITRAEYRQARSGLEHGKTRIIAFVRKEIWDIREDRKGLTHVLDEMSKSEKELPPGGRASIENHSSRLLADADLVFDFLNEIGRVTEMKKSLDSPGLPRPRGNWIHAFSDFDDIIDALRPALLGSGSVRQAIVTENVQSELAQIAAEFLTQIDGKVVPRHWLARSGRQHFRASPTEVLNTTAIPRADASAFLNWVMEYGKPHIVTCRSIEHSLSSGDFCSYDPITNTIRTTEIHRALQKLTRELSRLRMLEASAPPSGSMIAEIMKRTSAPTVIFRNQDLAAIFQIQDVHANILTLIDYVHSSIQTASFDASPPPLLSISPLVRAGGQRVEDQMVSGEASRQWLLSHSADTSSY
jgi:hypothetical protein